MGENNDSLPADQPLRIGIADDDRSQRRLLTVAVEQLGHQVVCVAADGEEFLKAAAVCDLDLAILDLDMPVFDGLAVAEELAQSRQVPVILVSGHVDAHRIQLENEPVRVFLHKPISISEVKVAIAQVLGR